MMRGRIVVCALLVLTVAAACRAGEKPRIGTYDARAVAIAFFNSPAGEEVMAGMMNRSKTAPDEKARQVIAAEMRATQTLNHLRAFSYGSVIELLAGRSADLKVIADRNRVLVIVPGVEIAATGADIEQVDVTAEIVALFHPTEKGKKWASEVNSHKPIPMVQALQIPADK